MARNFQVLALHAILANQKTMRHLNAMGGNFWRVGALLGLVLVSGCQTEQPATGEAAAKLAATCRGYGFKPGTDSYRSCIFQLDQQRIAQNRATRRAVGDALSGFGEGMAANAATNRPINCVSTPGYGGTVRTNCY